MENNETKCDAHELHKKMDSLKRDLADVLKTFEKEITMGNSKSNSKDQDDRGIIDTVKEDVVDVARLTKDRAVHGTSDLVIEYPLASIGIAAGVGTGLGMLIFGLLFGRK